VHPKPRERWLLVTSAVHMPRAVASFRKAGFEVVAWPVYDAVSQASMVSSALHEWLGLVAYRVLGRTEELLPRYELAPMPQGADRTVIKHPAGGPCCGSPTRFMQSQPRRQSAVKG
jgi:hypothetical protein